MAAGFDLDASKWGSLPVLSVQAQSDERDAQQRIARVEQPLWTGGRITGQISLASARQDGAGAALTSVQQEVLRQTSAAFFEVIRFEARLQAARDNTAEHLKLLDLIQRRVTSEVSPETDRVLAESRLQLAQTEEIQARRALEAARNTLNQLVGKPVGAVVMPPPVRLREYASPEDAVRIALRFSPDRLRVLAQIGSAAAELDIVRAQAWPSLVAGYERNWASIPGLPNQSQTRGYVGVQFSPGAGGGLAVVSAARAAEARRLAAVDSVVDVERQLTSAVSTAFSQIQAFTQQLTPSRRLLLGVGEVVESYMRQYQIGRKGWLDVLNAQREKIQARAALADVEASLEFSKLNLMLLTGDLNPSNLKNIHD
jgi:adhesin transport system outer membrane protein